MPRLEIERTIYTEAEIFTRVKELGNQIAKDYYPLYLQDKEGFKLILVGVLKGCNPFMADLSREISRTLCEFHGKEFPALFLDYISIESREKDNEQKPPKWLLDTRMSLAGAHVLLVEDIIHSGVTLAYIMSILNPDRPEYKKERPASLAVCALLDRITTNKIVKAKYVGLELEGMDWVGGYGMDSGEYYRQLPKLVVLRLVED